MKTVRYLLQLFGITDEHDLQALFPKAVATWVGRNVNRENMGYGFVEFACHTDLLEGLKYVHDSMKGVRAFVMPPVT